MTTKTTQQRASVIHGYQASPADHWFGWLADRLESQGTPTTVPTLPDSDDPVPQRWADALAAEIGTPDRASILVTHSLGTLAVLRHLRSLPGPWRLGTLVLVAGFVDPLPALPELDSFIAEGCDVAGLERRIDRLTIIRSDDDPLVPAAHTDRLADLLSTRSAVVPGAGHFLADDGVTSLPEALEAIDSNAVPSRTNVAST